MNTLIVYYSLNGNTEDTVNRISSIIGASVLRIAPKKAYPDKGFRKFLVGGGDVAFKRRPPLEPYTVDLSSFDTVVIATPVWASSFAPPIGTFIDENREALKGKRFAIVFCSAGGDIIKAEERTKAYLGAEGEVPVLSLIDPKTRPKEGDEELIKVFCEKL